jgi:hypothetical protein
MHPISSTLWERPRHRPPKHLSKRATKLRITAPTSRWTEYHAGHRDDDDDADPNGGMIRTIPEVVGGEDEGCDEDAEGKDNLGATREEMVSSEESGTCTPTISKLSYPSRRG